MRVRFEPQSVRNKIFTNLMNHDKFLLLYVPDEFLLIDQQFIVIIIIIIYKVIIIKNLTHIWMHEWFWFSQKTGASIPLAVNIIIFIMNIHTTNKVLTTCIKIYIFIWNVGKIIICLSSINYTFVVIRSFVKVIYVLLICWTGSI